jgi:hypothetical protein
MAIFLEAAYSKKLGLPNYSSHSFVVSIRTELENINQVPEESSKLYKMLQEAVDKEIEAVGFLPDATKYGMIEGQTNANGQQRQQQNGDAGISEKQLDLINRIIRENNANKTGVENMAVEMFGGGVRTLNRMQGSQLIDELFAKYPRRSGNGNGNGRGNYQRQAARS